MTNGEKLKEVFPDIQIFNVTENELGEKFIHIRLEDVCQAIELEWWNAEYRVSTTKGDLEVDREYVVSRSELINKIDILDSMYGSDFYWEVRKLIDSLSPIDVTARINELSSVTPQEPRKGHWIECMPGGAEEWCYKCSECNFWKYKKTINLSKFKFCPNCGSRNEVEE